MGMHIVSQARRFNQGCFLVFELRVVANMPGRYMVALICSLSLFGYGQSLLVRQPLSGVQETPLQDIENLLLDSKVLFYFALGLITNLNLRSSQRINWMY